ncbi:MAG: hypothetical protein CMK09_09085 [Ponticaulis sp.]|nr:hypothetical protein [Ponticaulis sp.]|tara:strand:- start:44188 stop:44610 length:423 start_codon:yes stop_codon:yes gene_type:complete
MYKKILGAALGFAALCLPAEAQYANSPSPALGQWHCISNSPIVSIDIYYQVGPNGQLMGQGSIVYSGTWRSYNVAGYGRWAAQPPDQYSDQWLYQFQISPQNHAVFSVYARPTDNPSFLNNVFYNPQTGNTTETSCQKVG